MLTGLAPCDGCNHRAACRSEKLACLDFQRWVNTGSMKFRENLEPTHKIYRMVFRSKRAA
ncbi:hypothetical protein BBC27_09675 [Acidithiobacillus ferrivorans]|uniref:Uncharacterized protein n=2 Tax=Acidithiobacillus ferrivorans TaxID=160808 RepID=A0A1B9BZI0_9PROT|nr:hypothetical protein BBC27_09675 [Acidithiobacillus ferrivorans]